ncbi:MAG: LysM peptidoglycan-binding domain-containing protein [Anaerolineae bacterium]|jgi:lysozyme|nr:LysM peptidoglycan-binding domain-containing protein [Anaerolineae bacterium]
MRDVRRVLAMVGLVAVSVGVSSAQRGDLPPVPLDESVEYTVVRGDTLDGLGAYFDVRPACIAETNELDGTRIFVGDVLTISVDCPAYDGFGEVAEPREDAPGRDGSDGTYVVRPRDTVDTIAQRLGVSAESLLVVNDVTDGRDLVPGQVLTVPANAPEYGVLPALRLSAGAEDALGGGAGDEAEGIGGGSIEGQTYVVQHGDTLRGIAEQVGVTFECLAELNEITDVRAIRGGTLLLIPQSCPAGGAEAEG